MGFRHHAGGEGEGKGCCQEEQRVASNLLGVSKKHGGSGCKKSGHHAGPGRVSFYPPDRSYHGSHAKDHGGHSQEGFPRSHSGPQIEYDVIQWGMYVRLQGTERMEESFGGELAYKRDVRDDIKAFDCGLLAGIGYKFNKEIKSMAVGVKYYYGLMNASKLEELPMKNSSLYIYMKIPIGAGSKKEKAPKD